MNCIVLLTCSCPFATQCSWSFPGRVVFQSHHRKATRTASIDESPSETYARDSRFRWPEKWDSYLISQVIAKPFAGLVQSRSAPWQIWFYIIFGRIWRTWMFYLVLTYCCLAKHVDTLITMRSEQQKDTYWIVLTLPNQSASSFECWKISNSAEQLLWQPFLENKYGP